MTPGGCSATSGMRGSTGASSNRPTSSAAACSPSVSPKYTVVAVTIGSVRLPTSVTFQPPSRRREASRSATPAASEMLKTRTSVVAASGGGVADEVAGAAVADELVTVGPEESPSPESLLEPIAWKPTSRKTTPRNSSTITMARRGSPEESGTRSFIWPTLSTALDNPKRGAQAASGHIEAEPAGGTRLLPTRSPPPQPLDHHRIRRQRLGAVDQRIQNLVVPRRRHREQFLDGFFFGSRVLPPLPFEGKDVVLTTGQPIGELSVIPRPLSSRHGAVHIAPLAFHKPE